jgi:hypothetical protein
MLYHELICTYGENLISVFKPPYNSSNENSIIQIELKMRFDGEEQIILLNTITYLCEGNILYDKKIPM